MNKVLLRKVRDKIKKRPMQFNMNWWTQDRSESGEPASHCGTACCIAGWAMAIHNRVNPDLLEPYGVPQKAIAALELTDHQASNLFNDSSWPEPFAERYRKARIEKAKQSVFVAIAVGRINHMLKTGE